MATVYVAGVDLEATLGFQCTDTGAEHDGAVSVPGELEIPGVRGAIFVGPDRVPVREFTITGFLTGANQAAVRTNFHKLKALVGSEDVTVRVADWTTVDITARCIRFDGQNYPRQSRANSLNEKEMHVAMTFRAANPYWRDTSNTVVAFTTSAVAMPQGTAPGEAVLESAVGAATTPTITCKDYLGATLWTATLASQGASEKYRITTTPAVMTIEKWNGSAWVVSDASLTAGVFPKPLPSSPTGYQSSTWPTLQATSGSWTATYKKQWR